MHGKKISLSMFINVLLFSVVLVLIGFGYYYYKGINPVEVVSNVVPTGPKVPEYKFSFAAYGPKKDFYRPYEVLAFNDAIYVSDSGNKRIVKMDLTGRPLLDIVHKDLKEPSGMYWDGTRLWVADPMVQKIFAFDENGQLVDSFQPKDKGAFADIVVNGSEIYILNNSRMTIDKYNLETKALVKSMAKAGDKPGELYYPYSINIFENKLYVADSMNKRINLYDLDGKYLDTYAKDKDGQETKLSVPRGLAFDKEGRLFTVEGTAHRVTVLDSSGQVMVAFNTSETIGEEVQEMNLPTDVAVDSNGRLYVLEFGYKRVLVFKQ